MVWAGHLWLVLVVYSFPCISMCCCLRAVVCVIACSIIVHVCTNWFDVVINHWWSHGYHLDTYSIIELMTACVYLLLL